MSTFTELMYGVSRFLNCEELCTGLCSTENERAWIVSRIRGYYVDSIQSFTSVTHVILLPLTVRSCCVCSPFTELMYGGG